MRNPGFIVISALLLVGCARPPTADDTTPDLGKMLVDGKVIQSFSLGTSLESVLQTLGIAASHEFTVSTPQGTYTMISCLGPNEQGERFFFLFQNDLFQKLVDPVGPKPQIYSYKGTWASRRASWDIDDQSIVTNTIAAPALTGADVQRDLVPYNGAGLEPANVAPAFVLADFVNKMAPQLKKDYATNSELQRRYDGCKAKLNMTKEQIVALFGPPLRLLTSKQNETVAIYADTRELQVADEFAFTGMAVVISPSDQVTAIYSHAFFNNDWKSNSQ
jgi:hypothetical protein